ncbi:hypothetical protein E0H73_39790 [Kribbella pittospori]|uniref:Uncharacterized protein n=1 Tax=Kribbella pittospori TaxID=722689 RepID=A0A4V2M8M9_9ACTN|nr:hypothetical protein [Kribbella pittospori]TCC52092.1 hypothetical protein E0H73_39790 [Kribbella pittospori]
MGKAERRLATAVLRLAPAEPVLAIHVAWSEFTDEPLVNSTVAQLVRPAETVRKNSSPRAVHDLHSFGIMARYAGRRLREQGPPPDPAA